jgi:hypothetical protein
LRSLPIVRSSEPPPTSILAGAFRQLELGLAATALVGILVFGLCLRGRFSGTRYALAVTALGVVSIAGYLEAGIFRQLQALARVEAVQAIERRAIARCIATETLSCSGRQPDALASSVLADAPPELGVERVWVRRLRVFDSFPDYCLVAERDVWCFAYSTPDTAALERLVRDHPFTDVARDMSDTVVVDWIAFALGVYAWKPGVSRSLEDEHASAPRVERTRTGLRVDFWERHPLIPGFGVRLRHTQVQLTGRGVRVTRGPMSPTLTPEWDRDPL